jgi:LysR family cys regulon transcriptional activator
LIRIDAVTHAVARFMNFQQLRSVRETVRQGFNLTLVAQALHTSQPGVSRQIKELEDELGVELFVRAGRRLLGLTPPGQVMLPIVERLLQDAENLRRAGAEYTGQDRGLLTVAATHTQARYALPTAVRDFRAAHGGVSLHLLQGSPRQIAQMVLDGQADLGIATETLADVEGLVTLPCYRWTHVVVTPRDHPLAREVAAGQALTLARLAEHPIVTYEPGYAGRRHIDAAFARESITPDIVLAAMDTDVIKTYAELGIGVGIIASVGYDEQRDSTLTALDARHLFAINTTRVAVKRGAWLRGYVYDFIHTFAPTLPRAVVQRALASEPGEDWDL